MKEEIDDAPAINIRSWSFSAETLCRAVPRARPCIGGATAGTDTVVDAIDADSVAASARAAGAKKKGSLRLFVRCPVSVAAKCTGMTQPNRQTNRQRDETVRPSA